MNPAIGTRLLAFANEPIVGIVVKPETAYFSPNLFRWEALSPIPMPMRLTLDAEEEGLLWSRDLEGAEALKAAWLLWQSR